MVLDKIAYDARWAKTLLLIYFSGAAFDCDKRDTTRKRYHPGVQRQ